MQLVGDTADRDAASPRYLCMSRGVRVGRATSGFDGFGWPARSNVPSLGRVRRTAREKTKREKTGGAHVHSIYAEEGGRGVVAA